MYSKGPSQIPSQSMGLTDNYILSGPSFFDFDAIVVFCEAQAMWSKLLCLSAWSMGYKYDDFVSNLKASYNRSPSLVDTYL